MSVKKSKIKKSEYKKTTAKGAKLGSGKRFAALTVDIMKSGKTAKQAKAIAAVAGRKKYGNKKMASLAKKGKK